MGMARVYIYIYIHISILPTERTIVGGEAATVSEALGQERPWALCSRMTLTGHDRQHMSSVLLDGQ